MSCTGFDVRDYFFGELPESERAAVERHVQGCKDCASALEELQFTRSGLLMLRDEEPPQRIGFVSDKVFQPSPVRRWLAEFWLSGARMGFASAAMLSVALLVFAAREPRVIEKRVEVAVAAPTQPQVDVKTVVAEALAQQDKRYTARLAASEFKHQMEEKALAMRVSEYTRNIDKQIGRQTMTAFNFGEAREKAQ